MVSSSSRRVKGFIGKKFRLSDFIKRRDSAGTQTESSFCSDDDASSSFWMSQLNRHRVEKECVDTLIEFCNTEDIQLSEETIHRYASFHNFSIEQAKEAIEDNRNSTYLDLKMEGSLKDHFLKQMVFPLPDLRTRKGNAQVLYMRPSRYIAQSGTSSKLIENLCYVLNDMSNTKEECLNGVAVVMNMIGYEENNVDNEYWFQVMQVLLGNLVPTRVNLLLIVDAPSFFHSKVWKQTKPMLSESFLRNVHAIKSEKLSDYLMEGYEALLPDELAPGFRNTGEIVEDYVDFRTFQDAHLEPSAISLKK
eukprot:scaffold2737_cov99-Cylindrotheca_fusiformis.AAC.1